MDSLTKALLKSFPSAKAKETDHGIEVNFPCPICQHPAFSFNSTKRVGQCFRASCHWRPPLEALKPYLQASFSLNDESSSATLGLVPPPSEIFYPEPHSSLVYLENGRYFTDHLKASQEVSKRGVDIKDQYQFGLKVTPDRIIIPVFEGGVLRTYVGRLFWWVSFSSKLRYTYPVGAKTSHWLFDWDNAQNWDSLTLVENTFVGIWLHKYNVTSNFGSALSRIQAEKILRSKAQSVVLLWDEGAESNAERAVILLKNHGVSSCYVKIKEQPDDYNEQLIAKVITEGHKVAIEGKELYLDATRVENTKV